MIYSKMRSKLEEISDLEQYAAEAEIRNQQEVSYDTHICFF